MEQELSDTVKYWVGKLIPLTQVGLVLKDWYDLRTNRYDHSLQGRIKKRLQLLLSETDEFVPQRVKFTRKIFFGSELQRPTYFNFLRQIDVNALHNLLLMFINGVRIKNAETYDSLKRSFEEGGHGNCREFDSFMPAVLRYICFTACRRDFENNSLLISMLCGQFDSNCNNQEKIHAAFADIQQNLERDFKEGLLHLCNKSFVNVDDVFSGMILKECGRISGLHFQEAFSCVKKVDFRTLVKAFKSTIGEFDKNGELPNFNSRTTVHMVSRHIEKCLIFKYIASQNNLNVTSENIYDINDAKVVVSFHEDKKEVSVILSCLNGSGPIGDSQLLSIGKCGYEKKNAETESLNEIIAASEGINPTKCNSWYENAEKSLAKELGMPGQKRRYLAEEIIDALDYKTPSPYYLIIEKDLYGEALIEKFSWDFPGLRFVLRSNEDFALRLEEVDWCISQFEMTNKRMLSHWGEKRG